MAAHCNETLRKLLADEYVEFKTSQAKHCLAYLEFHIHEFHGRHPQDWPISPFKATSGKTILISYRPII